MRVLVQQAYHYQDLAHNHDKIWAAAVVEVNPDSYQYLAVWGRRDRRYATLTHRYSRQASALYEFQSKCQEKSGKGYLAVNFLDPEHGAIPFFGSEVAGKDGPEYILTGDNLLVEITAFTARLKDGLVLPEADTTRLQLASYRVQSAVLLDLPEQTGGRLRESYRELEQVFLTLDSGATSRSTLAGSKKAASLLDL